ncbi:hypothetical protein [Desulfobacula sp.]|uniref:hypothetical protein n=1 Tax=Desulfobacula sp. TaxID=2593537 RepID=UPI0025BE1D9E|nr:hypothetical protein [Desulfobacula sp.]MBC2704861.1 hypothetical protein [Desulfobacula sp.]
MRRLWFLILFALIIPASVNAEETKILYHRSKIAGPQVSNDYYIKESVKRVNPKVPNLLQVKTYSTVTSPEGTTKYRQTLHINCVALTFTIAAYWSSGFGYDNGLMVDGKWSSVAEYEDILALTKKICPKQ